MSSSKNEPTYDEICEQQDRLEPWVDFFTDVEGSELGDQFRALWEAQSLSVSANDYETAKIILDRLYSILVEAKDEDWWAEMVEMSDDDYDRYLEPYNDEKRAEFRKRNPRPSERQAALPAL